MALFILFPLECGAIEYTNFPEGKNFNYYSSDINSIESNLKCTAQIQKKVNY